MTTRTVKLAELDEQVRSFLKQVGTGGGLIVEDETGRLRFGVIPYDEASPAEQREAWERIERLQSKVSRALQEKGLTEEEADRLLQEELAGR